MGFQIPGPTTGKVQYFVDVYQAVVLARPPRSFNDIPDHQAIICVIDTIQYEVASYAFSQQEFSLLDDHTDFRKRTWLLMDKTKANQVSGFGREVVIRAVWSMRNASIGLLVPSRSPNGSSGAPSNGREKSVSI